MHNQIDFLLALRFCVKVELPMWASLFLGLDEFIVMAPRFDSAGFISALRQARLERHMTGLLHLLCYDDRLDEGGRCVS